MNKDPKVDKFIDRQDNWLEEVVKLREIAMSCDLEEGFKWGNPCYMANGGNIVLIHTFKDYCAYLFFKGALMNDPESILVQQTENVQSARQVRFTSAEEIADMEQVLQSYIHEAIRVEKAGLKVELKKTGEYEMPEEFRQRLEDVPALKDAFESLTPGRQRAYILHFGQAKQSSTRNSRIDKNMSRILEGKGLND